MVAKVAGGGGERRAVGLTILLKIVHLEQIKVLGLIISRINYSSRVLIIHTYKKQDWKFTF